MYKWRNESKPVFASDREGGSEYLGTRIFLFLKTITTNHHEVNENAASTRPIEM